MTICLTSVLAGVTSCTNIHDEPTDTEVENNLMSVENAQNTLSNLTNINKVYTKGSEMRSIAYVLENQIEWQTSTENRLNDRDQVEVSFSHKSAKLIAIHKHSESNIDTSYVTQKLLFHRNNLLNADDITVYTMSLIPDRRYRDKHSDVSHLFTNFGNKGDFSGLVLFNNYHTGNLREIAQYIDGKLVYFRNLNYGDKATNEKNLEQVKEDIGDLKIYRMSSQTKTKTWYLDEVMIYGKYDGEDIRENYDNDEGPALSDHDSNEFLDPNGGGGGVGGGSYTPPTDPSITWDWVTVKTGSGFCVSGTIASLIQYRNKGEATDAVIKATQAIIDEGLIPFPTDGNDGIDISGQEIKNIIDKLRFKTVVNKKTYNKDSSGKYSLNESYTTTHFTNGGLGVGIIIGTTNHLVLLLGYNGIVNDNHNFTYHNSDFGNKETGNIHAILLIK